MIDVHTIPLALMVIFRPLPPFDNQRIMSSAVMVSQFSCDCSDKCDKLFLPLVTVVDLGG